MNDQQVVKSVNFLLFLASALLFYGLTYYVTDEHRQPAHKSTPVKYRTLKHVERVKEIPNLFPEDVEVLVTYTYKTIETEYIGTFFVTAYCPEECGGSWMTSSGATCYWSEDPIEPTTCAVDLSVLSYGDLIAIDFGDELKVYEAQDTGPGVQGYWIDCFVESMDEVISWPTGWFPVYSVTYVTHTYTVKEHRRPFNDYINSYLYRGSVFDRRFCRDDLGIDC